MKFCYKSLFFLGFYCQRVNIKFILTLLNVICTVNFKKKNVIHSYTFEDIQAMASEILKHTSLRPKIGIICGTGLGGIAEVVENPVTISYDSIPGFPVSTGS